MNHLRKLLSVLSIVVITPILASENQHQLEQEWGIGVVVRQASIPFDTEGDSVSSFVPMMFYKNDYFYIKGLEAGANLFEQNRHRINAITRMRFFDVPFEYQNEVQGDTFDLGGQYQFELSESTAFVSELMSDLKGNPFLNIGLSHKYVSNKWDINLTGTARYKSASFNSRYYALEALTDQRIGAGTELIAKAEGRFHITSNLYLLGSASVTALDSNAK